MPALRLDRCEPGRRELDPEDPGRSCRVLVLTSLLLSLSLAAQAAGSENGQALSLLAPHVPISIVGDGNFTPANGVRGGAGTPADPYVIEGWAIDASSADGIAIRNSTAYFTIRNVSVSGGGALHDGLVLTNVANGRVQDVLVSRNVAGISVESSKNMTIASGEFASNLDAGIVLLSLTNSSVLGNRVAGNSAYGIFLLDSDAAALANNNVSGNGEGIHVSSSAGVTLTGNRVERNSGFGVYSYFSTSMAISNNTIASNAGIGAVLFASRNATVRANAFVADGLSLSGDPVHYTSHTITPDNLVNGRPLRYYKDTAGLRIDNVSVGALIVANATNVTAAHLEITGTDVGLLFGYVSGALIADNNLSGNYEGISLAYTTNAIIANNTLASNAAQAISIGISRGIAVQDNRIAENGYGLYLLRSTQIAVHGNSFLSNTVQANDHRGPENSWDAGYPEGGNYWSDYAGLDNCSGPSQNICPSPDGIGDLPYLIDADSRDRYPIVPSNTRPVAAFTLYPPYGGYVGITFFADASTSSDLEDPADVIQVRWDWENDGIWDTPWQTAKGAEHQYDAPGAYTIRLEVRDADGLTNTTTREFAVVFRPDSGDGAGLMPAALLIAAVGAGVGAVLFFWTRVRRRRARP